ncbi:MAG: TetR/AcrR family transcriptional regulator [Acholeplasmataceae bacterium]|nr:TetR/AcrR family transcriptional regulator [Acholeplasmataceae bacterium]
MPSQTYFNLPKDKQERIMDAIIKEMGIHAYENVNIANIIRDSKISRGSFYQYFSDKDDLFNYFYQYIAQKKIAYFGQLYVVEHDMPFLDRFQQLYLSGFRFGSENPKILKAAKKIVTSEHFLNSKMMSQGTEQAIQLFISFIKHDQALGRIKASVDAELLAAFLMEFSSKVTLEEYFKDEADFRQVEHKIHHLIEMLQKGIE